MIRIISTLIIGVVFCISVQAQFSISAKFGLSGYQGDVHCRTDQNIELLDEAGLSLGFGIRYNISDRFGFRGEAGLFRLLGDETKFGNEGHAARGWRFNNNLWEISAMADYELFGKHLYGDYGSFKRTITPVIFSGIGLVLNRPEVDWKNRNNSNIDLDKVNNSKILIAIPVGVGLKYYISEVFSFGAELGIRLPISDYYDGISEAGNNEKNDSYGFGGIKVFFSLP